MTQPVEPLPLPPSEEDVKRPFTGPLNQGGIDTSKVGPSILNAINSIVNSGKEAPPADPFLKMGQPAQPPEGLAPVGPPAQPAPAPPPASVAPTETPPTQTPAPAGPGGPDLSKLQQAVKFHGDMANYYNEEGFAEGQQMTADKVVAGALAQKQVDDIDKAYNDDKKALQDRVDGLNKTRKDALAKGIDPDRLWRNKSAQSRFNALGSAIAGAILLGLGRTQTNQALDRMDKEIDDDVALQKQQLATTLQESGADLDRIAKAMAVADQLGFAKKQQAWSDFAKKVDQIGLSHKESLDSSAHNYVREELAKREAARQLAAIRSAILTAATERKKLRKEMIEKGIGLANTALGTKGAQPVNPVLAAESAVNYVEGSQTMVRTPDGRTVPLPPFVAQGPEGGRKDDLTADVRQHQLERINKAAIFYETALTLQQIYEKQGAYAMMPDPERRKLAEQAAMLLKEQGQSSDLDKETLEGLATKSWFESPSGYAKRLDLARRRISGAVMPEMRDDLEARMQEARIRAGAQ